MIKNDFPALALLILFALTLPAITWALPANQNRLQIQTGTSKRSGETAFSTLVSWRKGDANAHRANGLIFINGFKTTKPTSDIEVARKIAKGLNASINYEAPVDRGAIAKSTKDKAEYLVSNKTGFALTHITVRDYSNQQLRYSIPDKNFSAASVDAAIDFVYSADVEYVEGFSAIGKRKTAGGEISVVIDNTPPIQIKTDGKSTEQIEKELAQALGSKAQFSSSPIYPNFVELNSRNYKEFDGGEVQLPNLNASSITIDVNDSGLGVLTKFHYPDVNKPTDVASNAPYIFGFLIAGVLAFIFYTTKIKPGKGLTQA